MSRQKSEHEVKGAPDCPVPKEDKAPMVDPAPNTHVKMPTKKTPTALNEHNILFKTFDASCVLTNKSGKVVVKYVGAKRKSHKTCVWVRKVLVSNVKGPKTVWVPKNKA